ncbi:hypothetical protein CLV78_12022 [Aliiruegeria haliotis]|uniref:Uncharacterized protein n=1 Tax=Aliiruegeria haliotis TaxID=1280846 RepID=A0A2T0REI2_9RHOB|nr:hypothetical protein [Aliiruegeria haliotis]PRY19606.1 hypothetical protein CLV78_12022 [Aliiruegeria haliotis]
MHLIVFAAEVATVLFLAIFCLALASDGIFGQFFKIHTEDPVGRCLIRNAQIAFLIGYPVFFASTIAVALGLI